MGRSSYIWINIHCHYEVKKKSSVLNWWALEQISDNQVRLWCTVYIHSVFYFLFGEIPTPVSFRVPSKVRSISLITKVLRLVLLSPWPTQRDSFIGKHHIVIGTIGTRQDCYIRLIGENKDQIKENRVFLL